VEDTELCDHELSASLVLRAAVAHGAEYITPLKIRQETANTELTLSIKFLTCSLRRITVSFLLLACDLETFFWPYSELRFGKFLFHLGLHGSEFSCIQSG